MIYLKDEKTGVTVEDDDGDVRVTLSACGDPRDTLSFEPAEADALLRGLLRWKLETVGEAATDDMFHQLLAEWPGRSR